jgi:D-sedoheptulose 7-phosphate isomerase
MSNPIPSPPESRLAAAADPATATILRWFDEHAAVLAATREALPQSIARAAAAVVTAYRAGRQVLLFGNGGSFSDALHIEGELTNRFCRDHEGLPAICLGAGQATLTATANDYSYQDLFARLVKAYGKRGDVAIGLTTSGNSENVIRGLARARELGIVAIAMTGRTGGKAKDHADILLNVPSDQTPRIQEMHILAAHSICGLVEDALFPPAK